MNKESLMEILENDLSVRDLKSIKTFSELKGELSQAPGLIVRKEEYTLGVILKSDSFFEEGLDYAQGADEEVSLGDKKYTAITRHWNNFKKTDNYSHINILGMCKNGDPLRIIVPKFLFVPNYIVEAYIENE